MQTGSDRSSHRKHHSTVHLSGSHHQVSPEDIGSYGLRMKDIAIDRDAASAVLRIGVPAAIQYSLFAIANICIQTSINSFSHVVVEGNSAATNADSLIYDMMAAFYTACTSFIAQNLGARKKDRVLRTFFITLAYSFLMGLVLGVALFIFQRPFLLLFTSDDAVIHYGQIRIGVMAFVYCVSAFMDNATAAARGIGKSVMPTIIVVMGSVVFRIIWLLTVFAYFKTLQSLYSYTSFRGRSPQSPAIYTLRTTTGEFSG